MSDYPEFDAYVAASNRVDELLPIVANLSLICESRRAESQEALDESRNLLIDASASLDTAIEEAAKAAKAWTARLRRKVLTDRMAGLAVVTPLAIPPGA